MRRGRGPKKARLAATIVLALGVAGQLALPLAAVAQDPDEMRDARQQEQLDRIDDRVGDLDEQFELVLLPITILVGVLATGGILGVVFSIRDQRRVSQLHELTVTGETAAQRRAEETYTSFFEASQMTLNLVNDTLNLSREATQRAQESMHRNALEKLDDIEAKAKRILERIFTHHEFEEVISVPRNRSELRGLGKDLEKIEGYLELQDIEVHPHSRFVKGIALYLDGDIHGAIEALHGAAQDASLIQLRRFALYWRGSLERNLGQYATSLETFQILRADLREEEDDDERFELDRIILDTRFLQLAAVSRSKRPHDREAAVQGLLGELEELADEHAKKDAGRESRTSHEIAATRGHIYMWIAYDPRRLYKELHADDEKKKKDPDDLTDEGLRTNSIERALKIYAKPKLKDDDEQEGADFDITFGRAECDFALSKDADEETLKTLHGELARVERLAADRPGAHREERMAVEHAQTRLITASRRLRLAEREGDPDLTHEYGQVGDAYHQAVGALDRLSGHEIRLFSQVQRRDLTQKEFFDEVNALHKQAIERGESSEPAPDTDQQENS